MYIYIFTYIYIEKSPTRIGPFFRNLIVLGRLLSVNTQTCATP